MFEFLPLYFSLCSHALLHILRAILNHLPCATSMLGATEG